MSLLQIAAALGAGILAKIGYDKFIAKKVALGGLLTPLPGGQPAAQTSALTPQQIYAADMLVDSASFASNDPQNNAQQIADALSAQGLAVVSGPPQPRDPTQFSAFQNRQPSRWLYLFRWMGPGASPAAVPGFVKGINFYTIPSGV